jgi:predicted ArsR family transcriptional regulator
MKDNRQKVLNILLDRREKYQTPPTLAELASEVGIMTNAIRNHLMVLEKHGFIVREEGKARAITLTDKALAQRKATR